MTTLSTKKTRSFQTGCIARLGAYQVNGRHLTLEEADDWLAKLEAGKDAELPKELSINNFPISRSIVVPIQGAARGA